MTKRALRIENEKWQGCPSLGKERKKRKKNMRRRLSGGMGEHKETPEKGFRGVIKNKPERKLHTSCGGMR